MSFPQKVKSTLWAIVDHMALNPAPFVKNPDKDFTRNRKLGFAGLLRFCLSPESSCISHELLNHFGFNPGRVSSASAFIQQHSKLLPDTFRRLLIQFNLRFPLNKFKGKYFLTAADGCEFNIARNPHDPSIFHPSNEKSQRGFNMVHTISLYELIPKRYLDMVFQPGRDKNEFSALCLLMDRYSYGGLPIFVADRGFSSYNVFAHAMENGFFFAIRAKDINIKRVLGVQQLPTETDQWADIILTRSNAKKKRLHPELGPLYRCICKAVTFDFITDARQEYHMRLRIVRFQVSEGKYENIITNLPLEEFSSAEIKQLYNLRWKTETSYRDLKHTIGTANFHSRAPQYIELEVLCRMALYNFCTIITLEVPVEKRKGKWPDRKIYTADQAWKNLCPTAEVPSPGQFRLSLRVNRNCH